MMNTKPYYVAHPAKVGIFPAKARNMPKYPWGELDPGGWFEAPVALMRSLRAQASRRARRDGRKYRVEKRDDETVRVWRIT